MNDKKLLQDALHAVAKVPAEVLKVTKLPRNGHIAFWVRLPDGREREFRMSGSPTNHHGAPLALAKDVRHYASGYYTS